jgi:hypothetical protein
MFVTCIIALSVHVVMLQVFDVPYPSGYPTAGWPVFCSLTLTALALIYFYCLSIDEFARFPLPARCLFLFALAAMLGEALIRRPVMNGFATTAWIYSFVDNLPRLITALLICCLVVLAAPKLSRPWQKILGALAIAAIVQFLCVPLIGKAFGNIMASIAYLNHDEVYKAPYGWQIEVPAYITYMEPVAACFIMVALVWDRLAKSLLMRTFEFALLVLMINNTLIRPFVYIFYATFSPMVALLSAGQFFFEALTLAVLTTFTWRLCQSRSNATESGRGSS